jgi:signal transduction histidine kinase
MFRDVNIHKRLALVLWGVALIAFVVVGATLLLYQNLTLEHRARSIMEPYAQLVAVGTDAAVDFADPHRAQEILNTLSANPQILEADIFLEDWSLLAHFSRVPDARHQAPQRRADGIYVAAGAAELLQRLPRGGHLRLSIGLAPLTEQTRRWLSTFAAGMLVLLIVTLAQLAALQRAIVRPIASLTEAAESVRARADYDQRVPALGSDEVSRLGRSFNAMMDAIQERERELRRVTEEVHTLNLELERRVAERTAQLEAANRELETFSYSVSHDLRAPLRAIDGFSHLLSESYARELGEQGRRYLAQISGGAVRMGELIDDILDFARTSRREMGTAVVGMAELTRQVFEEVCRAAPQRKIELRLGDLPPALGDPAMIRQVLVNLLSNAVKFTAVRAEAEIEVGGERTGEQVTYHVKDNGAGFDMRHAHKLFGVFQRMHGAGQFEGTGIGLAIVKHIIERHGGRVWAESKVDVGTTVYFTLPRG